MDPDGPRTHMVSQPWGVSLRLTKIATIVRFRIVLQRNVRAPRRGMRPAGISGPARRVASVRGNDAKGRSAVRPLSVEAVEFSPALVPENNLISGWKTMSSGAGGVVPAVVVDPPVPTAAGVTFSAVVEIHVLASASDEDSLVAQASEQHIVCNTDPGKVPAISSVPPGDTLVNKPMTHSAQKIDLDGIPMEEVVVLEPSAFSVPDVSLDSRPMAGNMDWNPSEQAVPEEDQTSRPMEGVTSPAPLGHSVMKLHLDSQPSRNKLKPDRSGCPVPDDTPRRKVGFYDNQTVSDLLVDSNTDGSGDPVPRPAPSELAEHSTSVEHSLRPLQPEPSEHPAGTPRGVVGFSDNQLVFWNLRNNRRQVITWCQSRHRRSLQSSRGRMDTHCGERDYRRERTQCLVRYLLLYRESPRSHDSWKTHHRWINRKPRGPAGVW